MPASSSAELIIEPPGTLPNPHRNFEIYAMGRGWKAIASFKASPESCFVLVQLTDTSFDRAVFRVRELMRQGKRQARAFERSRNCHSQRSNGAAEFEI
jgi:hypothetical protein